MLNDDVIIYHVGLKSLDEINGLRDTSTCLS